MDDKLKIFENDEFGSVRTIMINNEPYFVGKDVAEILGYTKPLNAIATHIDKDDSLKQGLTDRMGRMQETIFINESGLYSLILSSKLPSAKKFKRWVTSEVLPAIRKTGGYINSADQMVNTYFSNVSEEQQVLIKGLLSNITEIQNKNHALDNENALLAQKNLQWADRPLINSLVRAYAASLGCNFAKAWTDFKKELLYRHSINLNARKTNYLNSTGKKTPPQTLSMLSNDEVPSAISTIVALCRENDVNIDHLLRNKGTNIC